MSKRIAVRAAAPVKSVAMTFNHNDWVVDSASAVKKTLGSTVALSDDPAESDLTGAAAATITFDMTTLPVGAVVVGGEVIVVTPYAGCTAANLKVGIPGTLEAFGASSTIDLMATANTRYALLLTAALAANTSKAIRLTLAYTVANATAGEFRVRVEYVLDGETFYASF